MAQGIRIDDLASPRYTETAAAAIAAIDETPFELGLEGIVEAARAESDVPLFEDADLFARLADYLEAVHGDTGLSRMGRFQVFQHSRRHLIQRSRLEALYQEHPEIEDARIERPLIIAGLPRSGTTHLLNLISADVRLRSLRYWESLEPIPSVACRRGEAADDRRENGRAQLALQDMMMPLFKNMYDLDVDGIHEEVELQHMCMSTLLMATSCQVEDWMRRWFASDQQPNYAFMKRALKALHWLEPRDRWVLKSPQHLACLPALLETFPDATLVVTHRDPVSVFASWATMLTYGGRFSRSTVVPREIANYGQLLQKWLLDGLVRDAHILEGHRVEHVYFQDFMADDFGTLGRIYERAELELDPATRAAMDQYIVDHPRGRHGKILYDLEADFGIDRESLYQVFDDYIQAFPVQREKPNQ